MIEVKNFQPSQRKRLSVQLQEMRQPLPFFSSQLKARQQFWLGEQQLGIYEKQQLVMVVSESHGEIDNWLVLESYQGNNWQLLEAAWRWLRRAELSFSANQRLQPYLRDAGFIDYTKKLTYRTALVLGGGGAKGAYQIGVWQALTELGIEVSIITGTSVGALNGALMLQNDFQEAATLWERIDTEHVLIFPEGADRPGTMRQLLDQLRHFAARALTEQGLSTEPLQEVMQQAFRPERLASATQELFIVTVTLNGLQEKVVDINREPVEQKLAWLLASSSFFPAMKPTVIDGVPYVDGGYRNNVPVDVALAQGATELIVVDVKGPGLTKRVEQPAPCTHVLRSSWSLGNILLFDPQRSAFNQALGYWETLRHFGRYEGHFYTLEKQVPTTTAWFRLYKRYAEFQREWQAAARKLQRLFGEAILPETILRCGWELLAQLHQVPPTKCYTIADLQTAIRAKIEQVAPLDIGLLSLSEWFQQYHQQFLVSDYQQYLRIRRFLQVPLDERKRRLRYLWPLLPLPTFLALMTIELLEE
ncbi:hypothetical protein RU97_GL001442 [Enterococcus canis]|uniref:PNPLA domain-containing protein n=1 Tax=Enterococcus canis TaxID=214095 RepID=A0A1L8RGF6_9ENTE|nr:patatin-like phospholipase family protein [Enterococcus canis]OJG18824.1 hypothetical protein RU97_GL001442 [Enterococcus canis]